MGSERLRDPSTFSERAFQHLRPLASHEFDLTLGYMAQGWWNVVDTRVNGFGLAGTGGSTGGNQYLHGPFLNVAMKW